MLDDAAYRTCPELGVVAFLADPFNCSGRIVKLDAIDLQEAGRAVELDADDLVDLAATQRSEDDGLIDTIEELRTDRLLQKAEYQLTRLVDSSLLTACGDVGEALTDEVGAEVARHDDDRILEVHQTALIIRQTTVIKDLQEDIEDVGVSLLDLVEEDDGVGLAADRFGELTTFVIAYISRSAPMRRVAENFSWYSLISIRVSIVSSSKRISASAFASSVFPTPVVPRKMNEPMGRLGS